jgi:hypothetical protein
VIRCHDRFNEGLVFAVWQDIFQERRKKSIQPRRLKRLWRSVVNRSTTNVCSAFSCIKYFLLHSC